jgi:hypothetical protein
MNFGNNFDPNCVRGNDYFYMNPTTLLPSAISSTPMHTTIGSINNGMGESLWNISPGALSSSPLHSSSINLSQSGPSPKQIANPWSSALLSAYMLHFWPNSSNVNGNHSGRFSPTNVHPLKKSSQNMPLIQSNHIHSGPVVQQHQQSMLELLRQTAQHHICSTPISRTPESKSNKDQCVDESNDSSPKKA